MFRVIGTKSFLEDHIKFFDKEELVKFSKFKGRVKLNPYIGRGLRVSFVREFKTNKGKRAYFIIYEEFKVVLFVGYSNKKNQDTIIKDIFQRKYEFREFAKKFQNS